MAVAHLDQEVDHPRGHAQDPVDTI